MNEKRCPLYQRNPYIEETGCSEQEYQDCIKRNNELDEYKERFEQDQKLIIQLTEVLSICIDEVKKLKKEI